MQIFDRRTIAIPGPMGDVTPEAKAARDQAVQARADAIAARNEAEAFAADAGALQDAAIASMMADPDSETHAELTDTIDGSVAEGGLRAIVGTTPARSSLLAPLRAGILDKNARCCVVVVGDSFPRAQEAKWIGFAERLAYRAGASAFPMLDNLTATPSAGMVWLQGAQGGTVTGDYLPEARLQKIALAAPDVVLHAIGCSDYYNQLPLETFQANLRAAFERIETDTPDVVNVYVQVMARQDAQNKAVSWQEYGAAAKEVVDEAPGSRVFVSVDEYVDLYDTGRSGNRFGFTAVDGVHPSHSGHKLHADVIGAQLGIPTREPSVPDLWEMTFPATRTYTSTTTLATVNLPARSYPRLIDVTVSAYHRTTVPNASSYAEIQIDYQRGAGTQHHAQRLPGGAIEQGIDLRRSYYLPPGVAAKIDANVRIGGDSTVTINGGATYSLLQVIENPF